jgi:hypothetical protein
MRYYVVDTVPVLDEGTYTSREITREETMVWLKNQNKSWLAFLTNERVIHEVKTQLYGAKFRNDTGPLHLDPRTEVLVVQLIPVRPDLGHEQDATWRYNLFRIGFAQVL